jgi:hypothetical protein
MNTRLRIATSLGLVAILGATGCADPVGDANPVDPLVRARQSSPSMPRPSALRRTLEDDYTAIANQVPGFGGLYLDSTGTVNVFLTDVGKRGQLTPLITEFLSTHGSVGRSATLAEAMSVRQGEFDFRELAAYYGSLLRTLDMNGVTKTDIDEMRNRIVIGVLDDGVGDRVRSALAKAQVPEASVIVEKAAPVVIEATLQQTIRPLVSGPIISIDRGILSVAQCTTGFPSDHTKTEALAVMAPSTSLRIRTALQTSE